MISVKHQQEVEARHLPAKSHYLLALIFGMLATLTLPPIHAYFLLIPAFSGLFWLLWHSSGLKRAFWTGWWFGLGYFTTGLYWFAHALLVEADKFAWMIPFAVLGLPSVLAIYYGLAALLTQRLKHYWRKMSALRMVICFTLIWLAIEWLRGHLFTGFPWNLIAYSWAFSDAMSQNVWWLGSYGLTAWTVALASLPAVYLVSSREKEKLIALSLSLLMVAMPFTYGKLRLQQQPQTQFSDQTLHIVQGNIPQQHKWDPKKQYEAVQTHVRLSQSEALPEDALIIWPETAYPYFLEPNSPPVAFIGEHLPPKGVLLTGAMRAQWHPQRQGIKNFYNSLHAVLPDGSVLTHYDKTRLVPFGEFVPFRNLLPLEKITHGMQDFKAGEGPKALSLPGYEVPAFQPLICYEAIFPEFTARNAKWLLNVTNDAWFGHSSGPYQHLQMARFRAIEQGLPMIRAANTGISAVFDSYGRELARIPLGEEGSITLKLPLPVTAVDTTN